MTSPSDPGSLPVVNLDNWDDNAWASSSSNSRHNDLTPPVANILPPSTTRSSHTLHRRRTSENASTTSRTNISWMIQHSRAESSDSVRGHPLRRDPSGPHSSSFNDLTVTRPILNLRLSPGPTVDADKNPSETEHEIETDSSEKEELVLIHEVSFFLVESGTIIMRERVLNRRLFQVTATDSLQGVSLKYGISMADLRKANQMWPSDSIHLRKSLNIPVGKASKLKNLSLDARMEVQETGSSSSTASLESTPGIRRVPASRLSFFPQRSTSDTSLVDTLATEARRPQILGPYNSSSSGLLSIPSSSNSSSIFSTLPKAFPIGKDAIMSRLSLDSGGTPPKGEQEHEMGVVRRNSGFNDIRPNVSRLDRDIGMASKTTNRMGNQGLRDGKQARSRNYDGYRIGEEGSERASAVIRTSQLEPSPEMLVPVLGQKRAKGKQRLGL